MFSPIGSEERIQDFRWIRNDTYAPEFRTFRSSSIEVVYPGRVLGSNCNTAPIFRRLSREGAFVDFECDSQVLMNYKPKWSFTAASRFSMSPSDSFAKKASIRALLTVVN